MIEIHLYGKLRKHFKEKPVDHRYTMEEKAVKGETISMLLQRVEIPVNDVYHIFYNRKLLASRCSMAETLGYRQFREDPMNWDLEVKLADGDRIGLFGKDMAALVV
jgi:hypothetical protein